MTIEFDTWLKMVGLIFAVGTPVIVSWLTIWYSTKRMGEVLQDHDMKDIEHSRKLEEHATKLHDLELQQVKLVAEVDGLAGKIFSKMDALKDSITTLTQRVNSSN